MNNMNEMLYKDYAYNNIDLLTNDITEEKTIYNLDENLKSENKKFPNKSLTIFFNKVLN